MLLRYCRLCATKSASNLYLIGLPVAVAAGEVSGGGRMDSIFTVINRDSISISDGVVFVEESPIGILCPSVLEGVNGELDSRVLSGPKGIKKVGVSVIEDIAKGLIDTGSILFGSPEEVRKCKALLIDPETSRTISYLCAISENCGDVCRALNCIIDAKILIVGCGGIGALSAFNLAGAGVKRITIVDGDRIEKSNLNRQFFWRSEDVGHKKVAVLKRELNNRYQNAEVQVVDQKVDDEAIVQLAKDFDLVLLTADEPLGVGDAGLKDLASAGAIRFISCGYFHANLSITYVCGGAEEACQNAYRWNRNPWFIGPSFGPSNTEIAGLACSLCLHALGFPESSHVNQSFVAHWSTTSFPRSANIYQ